MGENLPERPETEPQRAAPEPEPAPLTPEEAPAAERRAIEYAIGPLLAQGRRGANSFLWIAALSLGNSAIIHLGGRPSFVIGLGITQIADGLAVVVGNQTPDVAEVAKAIEIGFDVTVAGIVAGFGWLAGKRYTIVFGLGMVLYLLDGLLF